MKKKNLTTDTRDIKNLGPAEFRTGAKNGKEQICYYSATEKIKLLIGFWPLEKKQLLIK